MNKAAIKERLQGRTLARRGTMNTDVMVREVRAPGGVVDFGHVARDALVGSVHRTGRSVWAPLFVIDP
jgi:hypothetical protein